MAAKILSSIFIQPIRWLFASTCHSSHVDPCHFNFTLNYGNALQKSAQNLHLIQKTAAQLLFLVRWSMYIMSILQSFPQLHKLLESIQGTDHHYKTLYGLGPTYLQEHPFCYDLLQEGTTLQTDKINSNLYMFILYYDSHLMEFTVWRDQESPAYLIFKQNRNIQEVIF